MTPESVKNMVENAPHVVLSKEAYNTLMEICEKPSRPTLALVALMRHYRKKVESGFYSHPSV